MNDEEKLLLLKNFSWDEKISLGYINGLRIIDFLLRIEGVVNFGIDSKWLTSFNNSYNNYVNGDYCLYDIVFESCIPDEAVTQLEDIAMNLILYLDSFSLAVSEAESCLNSKALLSSVDWPSEIISSYLSYVEDIDIHEFHNHPLIEDELAVQTQIISSIKEKKAEAYLALVSDNKILNFNIERFME